MADKKAYPPISDYGYIADCHSAALVSKNGSIDWCCLPRIDSGSCFGRLLDWEKGGYCQIRPVGEYTVSRRYLPNTLVLETTFKTDRAEVHLLDCMTMHEKGEHQPYRQVLRMIKGIRGRMKFRVEVVPVFEYGEIKPWLRRRDDHYIAMGGSNGLLISGDLQLEMKHRHHLACECQAEKDRQMYLSILWRPPEDLDEGIITPPAISELDERLRETIHWWQDWSGRVECHSVYADELQRSAIVLKGLSHAPTGAIAAAPTTSLPEGIGNSRNWDYRFSWIRDSYFTVRSLWELGHKKEADGFRRFIERTAAGRADKIQVLYGVGGERRLTEYELPSLEGYRQSKPVRIGNAVAEQVQSDVYGELLGLAWIWHTRDQSPNDDYWEFLVQLVNRAAERWTEPDQGIWEMRSAPRHFVQSKAMCWSALDRGIRLAEDLDREAPVDDWREERDKIRRAIEHRGYDPERGIFIQAFDYPRMDAALLLLPITGFVAYDDERMVRTTAAVREELAEDGFLRRYAFHDDGIEEPEGVFCACTFWLAECLARQGEIAEARRVFARALECGNDLGLFSEEYDPRTGEMLGNMPQGLTHLSLIAAAVALDETDKI